MESTNLVRFLSDEAALLVRQAATGDRAQTKARLDEAAELLSLGVRVLERAAGGTMEARKAA